MIMRGKTIKTLLFIFGFGILIVSVSSAIFPFQQSGLFIYGQSITSHACPYFGGQCTPNHIKRIGADQGPQAAGDGTGEVDADIAFLGWGVSRHIDLNLYKCISFIQLEGVAKGVEGECTGTAHDTAAAGVAAAIDNQIGTVGVAPGARIWSIKVCSTYTDTNGNPYSSCNFKDLIDGLNFVAAHSDEIEVLSISLGSEIKRGIYGNDNMSYQDVLKSASVVDEFIEKVFKKGVVVVISAGNTNIDVAKHWPKAVDAITVSAITDTDGKCGGDGMPVLINNRDSGFTIPNQNNTMSNRDDFIATYSNYGLLVDLAAPGTMIYTTDLDNGYGYANGTSFAAPAVAGAAAVYKWLHPSDNSSTVSKYLKDTATTALDSCDDVARGYFNEEFDPSLNIRTNTSMYNGEYPIREPLLYMGNVPTLTPTPTSCDPNSQTLQIGKGGTVGSKGPKVAELQSDLTQLGYGSLLGPPGIDGKFGPFTKSAVKQFQIDKDLKGKDGIAGPETWAAICSLLTS
jgi:Subtilase family/Putative peptidoglycan binding domain